MIRNSLGYLAYIQHQRGAKPESAELFRQAEALQKEMNKKDIYLYSLGGFLFCDLLLDQGKYREVFTRAEHTLTIALSNKWLQGIGLDHLSLGRSYLAQWLKEGEGNAARAAEQFSEAVDFLRRAGAQHLLVLGLLGRAAFFRVRGDWPQAHRDLEEAMEIVQRSGMRLYEADCHLEYARLHLAQEKKEEARKSLATAREMIQEMGYHRRDREVKELEEQL
jgi:tetratricopeptide (TPR) repeat protein